MIEASIVIDKDIDNIYNAIIPEMETYLRSTVEIERKNQKLIFKITAQDITAFKATVNSIVQMLSVFYKVKEIK